MFHRKAPADFLQSLPESLCNYRDNLLVNSPEQLNEYQFFQSESGHFGLSPEGNVHCYTHDGDEVKSFLEYIKSLEVGSSRLLFTFPASGVEGRAFHVLKKIKPQSFDSKEFSFERATEQRDLDQWYESFNKEEKSNWPVPTLSSTGNFYVIKDQGTLVGGVANSLASSEYFWIGRLWIQPCHRRKGFGSFAMRNLEKIAFEQNKVLALTVWEDNERALAMYKKDGYTLVSSITISQR